MNQNHRDHIWTRSRADLAPDLRLNKREPAECEGGCGVIGIASSVKIAGKHLLKPLQQMRNRGNGKGGGIAAAGLDPGALGVNREILEKDLLLAIAFIEPSSRRELEREFIEPLYEIDAVKEFPHISDYRNIEGLEIKPPEVVLYFAHLKKQAIDRFREKHSLPFATDDEIGDEITYQNSSRLNRKYYNAKGEMSAFVLSHGKNLLVLKMVGFGDEVVQYYRLEEFPAHVWIGHHRYPTKGKVWHPGGAHPFIGVNEALVHNGDFANYHSIAEYLSQKNIFPHFLTDTEVGVLVYDYLVRTLKYPLEYVIECLAPTTERDFTLLSQEKQNIYKALQRIHIHSSPDGPWFFLIAESKRKPVPEFRLIGITDTSMLRPQVFALQEGEASIGFAASEKQAIDAALESLSSEDRRFWAKADLYWNARGGSYTDGGAFQFTVYPQGEGLAKMICSDKFGDLITVPKKEREDRTFSQKEALAPKSFPDFPAEELFQWAKKEIAGWGYTELASFLAKLVSEAKGGNGRGRSLKALTLLIDQHYPAPFMRRSRMLSLYHEALSHIIQGIEELPSADFAFFSPEKKDIKPENQDLHLVIDAKRFAVDGNDSLAENLVRLFLAGFKKFLVANCRGHRFLANGFGKSSGGVKIDLFGSTGDYLSSGIDGAEVIVHGNAQDQVGQILKDGKLVIYGDVGQTFLYAAKGGRAFVLGNAAGRPLINAVGTPRVIINGTCLDYLAESFMAGNPLEGGGFVVINAVRFGEDGEILEQKTPYPGSNLFSLPSGGAIYIRDPERKISGEQLNGGEIVEFADRDWSLIKPYLDENEALFNIPVTRLLEWRGNILAPNKIFRKIRPGSMRVLEPEEAWVTKSGKS